MAETQSKDGNSGLVDMRMDTIVRVALLGIGLGVVAWVLSSLLSKFAIEPLFCHDQPATGICANPSDAAGNIALVLLGIAGTLGLVRLGVYRPMLIVIAVSVCLWDLFGWLHGVLWYESLGWAALIFAATYVLFTWLVRPRNFFLTLVLLIIVIGLGRYITTL